VSGPARIMDAIICAFKLLFGAVFSSALALVYLVKISSQQVLPYWGTWLAVVSIVLPSTIFKNTT